MSKHQPKAPPVDVEGEQARIDYEAKREAAKLNTAMGDQPVDNTPEISDQTRGLAAEQEALVEPAEVTYAREFGPEEEDGDIVTEVAITDDQLEVLAAELQPPTDEDPGQALMRIVDQAVASAQPIEVIERLLAVHERVEANQARKEYFDALAALRPDLPEVVKTETVQYKAKGSTVNYRHEHLANIVEDLGPPMGLHGFSFRWRTEQPTPNLVRVTCIVSHRAGHSEETVLEGAPDNSGSKNGIQAIASTVSYLQRYTLKAAIGLAAGKDDDGQGGAPSQAPVEQPRAQGQAPAAAAAVPGDVLEVDTLPEVLGLFPADLQQTISGNQVGRLYNFAGKAGWSTEGVDAELGIVLKMKPSEIPSLGDAYEAIVRWFQAHPPTS